MATRPALRALATRLGILPDYRDYRGTRRTTSDASRVALLAAMGIDARTERSARNALRELQAAARSALLAPVRLLPATRAATIVIALPSHHAGCRAPARWMIEVCEENGRTHRREGRLRGGATRLTARIPGGVPEGYHTLRLLLRGRDGVEHAAEQTVIVTPSRCVTTGELLGARPVFGILANLYTLRSAHNWGMGHLRDLEALARWAGTVGAGFVGINPLHALDPASSAVSPYSPVSRLYRDPLYLDLTAIPELAASAPARARLASPAFRAEVARLRAAGLVEYERIAALAGPVLADLHRTFVARHRERATARGRAYRRYLREQGAPLDGFATFVALRDHLRRATTRARPWTRWAAPYRDPQSPAVREFAAAHREEIDRHRWLQFELDRQLEAVARGAATAGLPLGIYQDLALGSAPDGSDTWSFPGLFTEGAHLGAPPDDLAPGGQDWGLPAIDPRALAHDRYRYWIRLVRAAFRHAGALRIDHVMGLFRQFWIPAGHAGTDGAYVRFPSDELLAILALESKRANALVIGEDLGTVPAGLPDILGRWGILSTRVLYFERGAGGAFRPARRYPSRALVAANTHDTAPLAGFWTGRDLALRHATGQITSERSLAAAQNERAQDRRLLLACLAREHLLPERREPTGAELCAAVHAFLCRTPAALVGVALDDLVGEVDPVNLPGIALDDHPSWRRRLATPVEALARDPHVQRALAGTRERRIPRARRRAGRPSPGR